DCPTLRTRVCEAEREKVTTRGTDEPGETPFARRPRAVQPHFRFDRPTGSDGNVDAAMEVGRFERRHARPGTCSAVPLGLRRSNCERGTILSGPGECRAGADGAQRFARTVKSDDAGAADAIQYLIQPMDLSAEGPRQIGRRPLRPAKAAQRCSFDGLIEASLDEGAHEP